MKKRFKILLVLMMVCLAIPSSFAYAYQNPKTLSNEWSTYGSGDPYILKFKAFIICTSAPRTPRLA